MDEMPTKRQQTSKSPEVDYGERAPEAAPSPALSPSDPGVAAPGVAAPGVAAPGVAPEAVGPVASDGSHPLPVELVAPGTTEFGVATAAAAAPAAAASPPSPAPAPGSFSVKLLIPNTAIGGVIGKAGTNINKIRQASDCRVDVTDTAYGTDRVVTLQGPHARVHAAFSLIFDCVNATEVSTAATDPARPAVATDGLSLAVVTVKMLLANTQAGAVIGKGGEGIRAIRAHTSANIKVASSKEMPAGSVDRLVTVTGGRDVVSAAVSLVLEKVAAAAVSAAAAAPAAAMGMHAPVAATARVPMARTGDITLQVSVPHEFMGRVIGRAGSSINEIRTLTGCHIQIAARDMSVPERVITITGPPDANQMAQNLISMKMVQPQTPAGAYTSQFGMMGGMTGMGMAMPGMGYPTGMGGYYQQGSGGTGM